MVFSNPSSTSTLLSMKGTAPTYARSSMQRVESDTSVDGHIGLSRPGPGRSREDSLLVPEVIESKQQCEHRHLGGRSARYRTGRRRERNALKQEMFRS